MDVPLTPIVVDVVTFDRAPLGRRGYNEDQVDDFLDRVQATLAGEDQLTAREVREVEFDPAPFIRRGYNEDQVDEFLDLVVEELDRRSGGAPPPVQGGPSFTGGAPDTIGTFFVGGPPPGGTPGVHVSGGAHRTQTPPGGLPAAGGPNSGGTGRGTVPGTPPRGLPGAGGAAGPHNAGSAGRGGNPGTPPGGVPAAGGAAGYGGIAGPGAPGPAGPPFAWVPYPASQPRPVPPPTPAEQTNPMLFAQPPSLPSPSTQPLRRAPEDASGPPDSSVAATTDETGAPPEAGPDESPTGTPPAEVSPSVAAGQAASAFRAGSLSELVEPVEPGTLAAPGRTLADYAPKPPVAAADDTAPESGTTAGPAPDDTPDDTPEPPAEPAPEPESAPAEPAPDAAGEAPLPFPPAPPGEPGYAPADVTRLMRLLAASPDREQLTSLTFALTPAGGYHTGAVDAFRQAWVDALPTKRP